jgi:hypothetical protein
MMEKIGPPLHRTSVELVTDTLIRIATRADCSSLLIEEAKSLMLSWIKQDGHMDFYVVRTARA